MHPPARSRAREGRSMTILALLGLRTEQSRIALAWIPSSLSYIRAAAPLDVGYGMNRSARRSNSVQSRHTTRAYTRSSALQNPALQAKPVRRRGAYLV